MQAVYQITNSHSALRYTTFVQAIQASFVVPIDLPTSLNASGQSSTMFIHATKTFHLHIQSSISRSSFVDSECISHYTEPPLEAAFNGVFLDGPAARMYLALYGHQHSNLYECDDNDVNASAILNGCVSSLAAGVPAVECVLLNS